MDNERQFLSIELDKKCLPGHNYTITFVYRGDINRDILRGLYISTYQDESGKKIL